MRYDFDTPVDRKGTHTCKLDKMPEGAPQDALPMWVADMDLPCAEPIIRALHDRIDRKIFGYTLYENEECKNAVIGWYRRRFGWELDQVREYIDGNIRFIEAFVKEHLPKAEVIDCQGTYLVWLNLGAYCPDEKALELLMHNTAKVALDEGYIFGEEGIGYERINVAAPRSVVKECMKRIEGAVKGTRPVP